MLAISASGLYGASGAGIYNYGTLHVSSSTFSGNNADAYYGASGGGIENAGGTLIVSNSTFAGNSATSSDLVESAGGAISNGGTLTVTNSTVSGNTASLGGGFWNSGTATLKNTIVANNRPGGNCRGATITDGGGNLSYPGLACPGINANPMLGPLQNNSGPTETMALGPGSAAIDAGNDAICAAEPVNNLDQRGVTRPIGSHCDIGAVEQEPYPSLPSRMWLPAVRSE